MGIFKGSATLTRYNASGRRVEGFADFIDERIRVFAFRDIENSADEQAVGWVSAADFMDTAFAYAAYALDPYIVLGLRVDKRKLPSGVLKKYHRLELRKVKRERDGQNISRAERETLKEKVKLDLLRRIPPSTQTYDVVWDTARNEVWFGGASRGALDLFEDYFRRCFNVELVPRIPYLAARDLLPQPALLERLEQARPWDLGGGEAA